MIGWRAEHKVIEMTYLLSESRRDKAGVGSYQ